MAEVSDMLRFIGVFGVLEGGVSGGGEGWSGRTSREAFAVGERFCNAGPGGAGKPAVCGLGIGEAA